MLEGLTRHTVLSVDETGPYPRLFLCSYYGVITYGVYKVIPLTPRDYTKHIVRALRRIMVHRPLVFGF
jgi:hypothetical protein